MNNFLPRSLYIFLFFLLGIIYFIGLYVPLIDNDSAHHATIALHMHLTGDYASLVDWNGDYLDKPHLLFWLSAFGFKIFGVTSFAYKFPSFLFTILGIYSTYRLGKTLYNEETGRLSSLLLATAFAFIISISDVRMEAILTASIAFACWQLADFVKTRRIKNVILSALALALGFSTKGDIGVFVPAVFIFGYILYRKDYPVFLNWKWFLMLLLFGVFISPVLYSYYLQYNLHPETIVRGKDHINGVKFILFNQSVERFSGGMGGDSKNDYLFFIHTFFWAFAPWSILTFWALVIRIGRFFSRTEEWGTTFAFLIVLLVVSFSGFKLPHYINIVFPLASVMTAAFILKKAENENWQRFVYLIGLVISTILLLLAAFINAWAFPVTNIFVVLLIVLLFALFFYFILNGFFTKSQKAVLVPVSATLLFFFLMNANFYPKLLKYQAGKQLAIITKGKLDPANVYIEPGGYSYSSSYNFYTRSLFKQFNDSLLTREVKPWLLTEPGPLDRLKEEGYEIGKVYQVPHFRITKLNLKFMNPSTRSKELSSMMIVELLSKKQPVK